MFKILQCAEKVFRFYPLKKKEMSSKQIMKTLINSVQMNLYETNHKLFSGHPLSSEIDEEEHNIQLIKLIAKTYLSVRLFSHGKKFTKISVLKAPVRSKLNKIISFSNT